MENRNAYHATFLLETIRRPASQVDLEHALGYLDTLAAPCSLTKREGLCFCWLPSVLALRLRSVLGAFATIYLL